MTVPSEQFRLLPERGHKGEAINISRPMVACNACDTGPNYGYRLQSRTVGVQLESDF